MHTGRWVTRHLAEAHLQKARVSAHLLITARRKSLNSCLNGKSCVYTAGNSQLSSEDVARQQAGSCTALVRAVSAVQLAGLAHTGRVIESLVDTQKVLNNKPSTKTRAVPIWGGK